MYKFRGKRTDGKGWIEGRVLDIVDTKTSKFIDVESSTVEQVFEETKHTEWCHYYMDKSKCNCAKSKEDNLEEINKIVSIVYNSKVKSEKLGLDEMQTQYNIAQAIRAGYRATKEGKE